MNIPAKWKSQLKNINETVNRQPFKNDIDLYKQDDFWTVMNNGGDCDDYALTKLFMLVESGWPIENLHLACCWTETNEYHAVLIVETPDADYMLDNRQANIIPINELPNLGYRPDRIQAVGGERGWSEWLS